MYKKVYISLDCSDLSAQVLQRGIELALTTKAKVRVVNVIDLAQFNYGVDVIGLDSLQGELTKAAKSVLAKAKSKLDKYELSAEVEALENIGGTLSDIIVADAKAWAADIIVLGTHNLNFFTSLLSGSVVEDVANSCSVPLLLVPSNKK